MDSAEVLRSEWMAYALTRIQSLVDLPRHAMTDDQLSIYTYAGNALAGGDPVIAFFDRGPGRRLCRVCLAEWGPLTPADHVSGCPVPTEVEPELAPGLGRSGLGRSGLGRPGQGRS